jgi:hypothetical protein
VHLSDDELAGLLRRIDHQPPAIDVETVIAAARRRRAIRVGPIAAGIVLCAAAAAAAMPGSPVRSAIARVFATRGSHATPTPQSAPDTTRAGAGTGIAFVPGADLDIRFRGWQNRGQLRVSFADLAQLSLVPRGGDAAFAVGRGQVAVDNRGSSASFSLEVPRTVQRLRVYVDTTVVLRKNAGGVGSLALPDSAGAYTIDLSSPHGTRPPRP